MTLTTVLFVLLSLCTSFALGEEPALKPGDQAALFVLPGIYPISIDGTPIKLSDSVGPTAVVQNKAVVIGFYASWCVPCLPEMEELVRLDKRLATKGVQTLAITIDSKENLNDVQQQLGGIGVMFPVLHDNARFVNSRYGVKGLPLLVILDGDGRVVRSDLGILSAEQRTSIEDTLQDLISRNSAAPAIASRPAETTPTLPAIDGRLVTGTSSRSDFAVVVGLEDYAFLPDVPFGNRDADAFESWALYTRGIPKSRIKRLTAGRDGSREHLLKAVEAAGKATGDGGTVWVYYAGHGAMSPSSGERLLLGDDARADMVSFESRGVEVSELEALATAGGGRAMTLIDACFTAAGRDGAALIADARFAIPTYVASVDGGVAQWNAVSAAEVAKPLAGAEHGAFTYFAIGALRGWADGEFDGKRDGRVTAGEANAFVVRALKAAGHTGQTPLWVGNESTEEWVLSTGKEASPID